MTDRHEELIAGWLDGSLAPAEEQELLDALRADPALAEAFAAELEIHRGLQFAALRSDDADHRAADRILHYVRASQEGTKFVEGVRQRALAGGRRRSGRFTHPATSYVGPALAALAAVLVLALVGMLALASHSRRQAMKEETAERPRDVVPPESPKPEVVPAPAPRKPFESDEERRKRIEEELRTAKDQKKPETPPKPEVVPAPAPEEKPVAVPPKPETPPKPDTKAEIVPALARLEGAQGEVFAGADRTPAATGLELRDGAAVETAGTAVLRFMDATRVELSGEAKLHEKLAGKRSAGRGMTLAKGSLAADVAKQPAGQSFLFVTPHAEIQVLGTRLSITAGAETRVDVQEGQVRVTTLKSGQVSTVSAGQGLEVGPAGAPRAFLLGLHAVYFDQNNYKGQALERVDAAVDLFLDQGKNELPPIGTDRNFAVRWEGRFLAETAGEYVFLLSIDGQAKLTLDAQDLVSDPRGTFHPIARSIVRRKLAAGWHDFVLEYSDDQGNSRCMLRYLPPGAPVPDNLQADGAGQPIPPRLFSHNRR